MSQHPVNVLLSIQDTLSNSEGYTAGQVLFQILRIQQ